jgi:hypothetical protein
VIPNQIPEDELARAYRANIETLIAKRTDDLRKAMVDLETSHNVALDALVSMLGLHDPQSEAHSKRVVAYTVGIANALGATPEHTRVFAQAAYLHDIGNVAVPVTILQKASALSAGEVSIVRQHCWHGYQLLRTIPWLAESAEIVYAHHERYDGTGYPRGLNSDDIPIGARIVAIADALDAITSDRLYRQKQSFAGARDEIQRCAGRQFDPVTVRAFLTLTDKTLEELQKDADRGSEETSLDVVFGESFAKSFTEHMEKGKIIPPCDPDELRRTWAKLWPMMQADFDTNTGLHAVAGGPPLYSQERVTQLRCILIRAMFKQGGLAEWMCGEKLADAVFRVAAEFPFLIPGQINPDDFVRRVREHVRGSKV